MSTVPTATASPTTDLSAGLHPEIGGGVWVWALDPRSGQVAWRRTLRKQPAKLSTNPDNATVTGTVVPHSFLNDVPRSEGDQLDIGGFVFDPRLTDAELEARLETPPPKKK